MVRYRIVAGNGLDRNIRAYSQMPGQQPSGPILSPWCNCSPFARISHVNRFRTSIVVLGV